MKKKTVWALVSVEVEVDDLDDETVMDWVNDELVEYGFTVDDIGFRTTLAATEDKE